MTGASIVGIALVSVVSGFIGYAASSSRKPKAKVYETPEKDPRGNGWEPEDGAGYMPTEERSGGD